MKEKLETIFSYLSNELNQLYEFFFILHTIFLLAYQSITLLNGQPLVTNKLELFPSLHVPHHHVPKEPRALSALSTIVMPDP